MTRFADIYDHRAALVAASRGDAEAQRRMARVYFDAATAPEQDDPAPLAVHALVWARIAEANTQSAADKGMLIHALGLASDVASLEGAGAAADALAAEVIAVSDAALDLLPEPEASGFATACLDNLAGRVTPEIMEAAKAMRGIYAG